MSRYMNSFLKQVFLYFLHPPLRYISSAPFVKCVIRLGRSPSYSVCLQRSISAAGRLVQ